MAGPVLILAPTGRDAEGAAKLFSAEGFATVLHLSLDSLRTALDDSAGVVLLADEALLGADVAALASRIATQPPWSDLPFIVLTQTGASARRQMAALNLPEKLGNVLFLERPLNAISLISAAKSALRARYRQRQMRDYLAGQVAAAEQAAALLALRIEERTAELEAAETERRKIAAALAQSQKMEAVGQLTGGLAHDFNNMLAGVSGALEIMQVRLTQGRTEQLGRYIGLAQQGAQRAAALTQRLLAFSRRQTLDPKPTGLIKLIAGMAELIDSTAGPTITTAVTHQPGLWLTLCDAHQLENALLNLCINARDAMPGGGQLTIETRNAVVSAADAAWLRDARAGEYVMLGVTDTGCGMSPKVMARAFDPFFTTKPLGEGTGLGLSMAYGFVQQSGGHVQISSETGQGTTVRLYLPRFDGAEESATEHVAVSAPAPRATRKAVLVVDDETAVRLLVAEAIADHGYTVREAPDGASGLEILRSSSQIDLLVTDVGMPGMNGRQLADAARDRRPDLKILFITGYAETLLTQDSRIGPGMEVMTKPFAISELVAKVRAITGG